MAAVDWHRVGFVFDGIASRYDELWTRSTVGRLQRDAVWRRLDSLFRRGDQLLDLGCGTGEDPLHFAQLGIKVALSMLLVKMVRVARARGVDAPVLALGIEELDRITGGFDGVISDVGALTCVSDLNAVRYALARLLASYFPAQNSILG